MRGRPGVHGQPGLPAHSPFWQLGKGTSMTGKSGVKQLQQTIGEAQYHECSHIMEKR